MTLMLIKLLMKFMTKLIIYMQMSLNLNSPAIIKPIMKPANHRATRPISNKYPSLVFTLQPCLLTECDWINSVMPHQSNEIVSGMRMIAPNTPYMLQKKRTVSRILDLGLPLVIFRHHYKFQHQIYSQLYHEVYQLHHQLHFQFQIKPMPTLYTVE